MADNVAITAGSGTTIATDDVGGGVQVQRVKPTWGPDGTANDTSQTNPLPVAATAFASGGYTGHHKLAAASNNATSLKASAGTVYRVGVTSKIATFLYVKFYDKASAPAPGTDNALLSLVVGVPPGAYVEATLNQAFATGIAYAIVANNSDTDNTSVAAGDCVLHVGYK